MRVFLKCNISDVTSNQLCERTPQASSFVSFSKRTRYTGVCGSQAISSKYLVRTPVTFICK